MEENQPPGTIVGVVEAFDFDIDLNGFLTYASNDPRSDDPFSIDENSGKIFTTRSLDREARFKFLS